MSSFDIQLLVTALASVLVLVALIVSRIHMHPLLALLVVSMGVGFATGMDPTAIVKNLTNGAGKTLGAVGVVIALGAMLGKILADSGVTEQLANAILRKTHDPALRFTASAARLADRHAAVGFDRVGHGGHCGRRGFAGPLGGQ